MAFKAWAVCLTPFDAQGRIDEAALREHLCRIRDAGACAYVGSSNVGEGFTFTRDERDRVFAIAVEECKGKTPVRAAGYEPQSINLAAHPGGALSRCSINWVCRAARCAHRVSPSATPRPNKC